MTHERDAMAEFDQRVDAPYWHALDTGELRLPRCTHCHHWNWPADWRCPTCGSYEFGWERIEPRGTVFSWIRTHYPFVPEYEDLLPYTNVLVELDEAEGARMMGLLVGDTEDARLGESVEGLFEPGSERTGGFPVLRWTRAPGVMS
jgi:uncharacterized OB-fold protein